MVFDQSQNRESGMVDSGIANWESLYSSDGHDGDVDHGVVQSVKEI